MTNIFYAAVGVFIVISCMVFFYKNKQKQACLNIKQEPIIQLDTINDAVISDQAEVEQVIAADKKVEEFDNMDIILLQIKALADRPYAGYELLQVLTSVGLNFGKRDIFHGNNFSVAAATTEGSFPVDNMGSFKCLGLMMFMQLNPKKKLMMTFDLMLDTARQLIEELDGEIYDDLNQPINAIVIKRLREKICTIETSNLYASDLLDNLDNS